MKYRKIIVKLYFIVIVLFNPIKSSLIWPEGASRIQVITGFGIPVDLKKETVIIGLVIKGNYLLPTNASDWFRPGVIYERRKRSSMSRWDIYKLLEQESEMRGFGGRQCVLRAICEAAESPIDRYHGFFNELFHATFTPTSTTEALSHHTDNEYFAAHKLGMEHRPGICKRYFSGCKKTFVEMFTTMG